MVETQDFEHEAETIGVFSYKIYLHPDIQFVMHHDPFNGTEINWDQVLIDSCRPAQSPRNQYDLCNLNL